MIRAVVVVFAVLVPMSASAEALPYPKGQGQCAGSYMQSGGFCVPKSGGTVRPSVPKPPGAQCPSGWTQSGGACEKMR